MDESDMMEGRYTSHEIFERIIVDADEELSRSLKELFFSSLAAGFAITLTFLLYVEMYTQFGGDSVLRALLYPLGFVFIILGNYQLFTENTLPPVALVLERVASIPALLYMWGLVLFGNVFGAALGAAVLAFGGVFSPEAIQTAISLGQSGIETNTVTVFFRAVFAGFIVAGVVWLDFSFDESVARLLLIYFAFAAIPLGGLYHVVVSTTEVLFLIYIGEAALLTGLTQFILPVLFGNIFGGVALVTVVNYFQTPNYIQQDDTRRLETKEWLFKYRAGREREEIFGEDSSK